MSRRTTKVYKTTFREQVDATSVLEGIFINRTFFIRLDAFNIHAWHIIERIHTDFIVEVTNITNDRLILHLGHMVGSNDTVVARSRDIDVSPT